MSTRVFADLGRVRMGFKNLNDRLAKAAHVAVDKNFIDMENYAKSHAPWTDRTGDARRSIQKIDLSTSDRILFYLIIGMPYGIWLELANQGKYQILRPTLTIQEPQIKKDLRELGRKS